MKVEEALRHAYTAGLVCDKPRSPDGSFAAWQAAFLASLRANGFVVVHEKPTKQMIEIGQQWFVGWMDSDDPHSENGVKSIYAVMLAAAQENDDGR